MQKLQHSRLLGSLMPRATSDWAAGLEMLQAMLDIADLDFDRRYSPSGRAAIKSRYYGQSALQCIGSGHFGSVWKYKGNVYKVMTEGERDGAVPYLRWCMANPSKFAPSVKYMHTMRDGTVIAVVSELQVYREGEYGPDTCNYEFTKSYFARFCSDILRDGLTACELDIPGLEEFLHELRAQGFQDHYGTDLHPFNVMFRNDGTPVVNDPFSGRFC